MKMERFMYVWATIYAFRVYELILDNKHTRLRVMEVAQAIKEAASATPPAFSPGASRGATPSSQGSHMAGSYGDMTGKVRRGD